MSIKRTDRAARQGIKRRFAAPAKATPRKRMPIKAAARERREARMEDVAKLAGVSAMTVSRALRNPAIVTPDTLKRIEAAIDTTGYLPNRVAGSLSSRRTNVIGLIVPSLRNAVFVETIQGVADTGLAASPRARALEACLKIAGDWPILPGSARKSAKISLSFHIS
jgi:transcriptional regulator with XRE-family HTH domain